MIRQGPAATHPFLWVESSGETRGQTVQPFAEEAPEFRRAYARNGFA